MDDTVAPNESDPEDFIEVSADIKAQSMALLYEMNSEGVAQYDELLLERITAQIGEHKVGIISVAGKPRGGKTFFLNFLLRVLRNGDARFLSHESIGGYDGIPFKNGYIADTKGILVWPKVFFRRDKFGEEIAILLVDTQGTFDNESDIDQSINYFAVSLLLSSIQVFNTKSNLDLQDFDALNQFIAYSDLSGDSVGQHMFFLIRDAPIDKGLTPSFLTRIMEGSRRASKTHELITGVMRAFLRTECYLVPRPDQKLVDADMEIKAADVGKDCHDCLADAANHLIQNLEPKTVQGVTLTGSTLKSYAKDVFEKMKSKGRNKIGTLFDAMKTMAFDAAKKGGKAAFKDGWNRFNQIHHFQPIAPREFAAESKSILEQAKNAYLSVVRYGSEESRQEHFNNFLSELMEKCEDKKTFNDEKYRDQKIASAYEAAIQLYEKESQPTFMKILEQRSFDNIQKQHQAAYKKALSLFDKETNEFLMDTDLAIKKRMKLVELIENRSFDILRENSMQSIREKGRELCDLVVNKYRDFLMMKQSEITKPEEIEKSIEEARNQLTDNILEEKNNLLTQIQQEFPQLAFEEVDQYLETINDKALDFMIKRVDQEFKMIAGALLKTQEIEKQMHAKEQEQQLNEALIRQEIGILRASADQLREKDKVNEERQLEAARKEAQAIEKEKQQQKDAEKTRRLILGLQQSLDKSKQDMQLITGKPVVLGIDLGTTYSCVGVCVDGEVTIIPNEYGKQTTPSQVAFTDTEILVGEAARQQATRNSGNTIYDTKRLIGRKFNDPVVQQEMRHVPFEVVDVENEPRIKVTRSCTDYVYTSREISGMILKKLKELSQGFLDRELTKAVITVPAYFNDSQRNETILAAEEAGLQVLRIVNEPTAAAIAYGINNRSEKPRTFLVFDFGGGTLDVSIITAHNGTFETKATSGDTHLGGEDLNNKLLEHVLSIASKKGFILDGNKRAVMRLYLQCELAKIQLSSETKAEINVPSLVLGKDFKVSISRAKFENICEEIFERALQPVKQAMSDANLTAAEIDEILMVGGSSRIPKVRKMLSELLDNKELNTSLNADEVVAYGAAIQAAKISGDQHEKIRNLVFKEVTPLSLGIEVDWQTTMSFKVYQGERKRAALNYLLGQFTIEVTSAKQGETTVDVTFSLDENGILEVTAEELCSGKSNSLKIEKSTNTRDVRDIERSHRSKVFPAEYR
ncbi:unnamed protein product, partial [Mesorhabditis belari]|uniref:Guanylate-binding protein N-terminal domain-containing protein n=1 Tax=Mesorhabditis belari TaxID=2138241 RepID=A0AAF3ETK8_9BILA